VPGAVQIESDSRWPEAAILRGTADHGIDGSP